MTDLPIACSLTAPELQKRSNTILRRVRALALKVDEMEAGFAYSFASDEALLADLCTMIQLEHRCCPFLRFSLIVEPGNGPITLELTGLQGTKEFLKSIFEE
jgi:hypothetical protein